MRPIDVEGLVAIGGFFVTVIVLSLGIPLLRSYIRRKELEAQRAPANPALDERLARMESALEAVAVEVERIGEGQRFVSKLLAEAPAPRAAVGRGEEA